MHQPLSRVFRLAPYAVTLPICIGLSACPSPAQQGSAQPAGAPPTQYQAVPPPPDQIYDPLVKARQLITKGQASLALPLIQRFIASQPGEPAGHFWMGVALDETGQPSQAIWAYSKSLELASKVGMDAVELRVDIGNTLLKLNRVDDAIFNYRRAVEIDSKSAVAHFNLARALLRKNQPAEAFSELNRADELGFTDPSGYLYRAVALKAMGKPEDAKSQADMFLQRLSQTPQNEALKARINESFNAPAP